MAKLSGKRPFGFRLAIRRGEGDGHLVTSYSPSHSEALILPSLHYHLHLSRLLCQVLEHMGYPEEPRLEMRMRCPQVMSMERVMAMPIYFILQQQDQEEVPAPEPEVQRSPAPQVSPPSPPLHTTSAAAADTPGLSYSAHHSPEYVHASSREIAGVMDAICSLAATQAA